MLLPPYDGHICRLQALLALLDVELDGLSLFQVPEPIALDGGVVDKDIRTPLGCELLAVFLGRNDRFRRMRVMRVIGAGDRRQFFHRIQATCKVIESLILGVLLEATVEDPGEQIFGMERIAIVQAMQ